MIVPAKSGQLELDPGGRTRRPVSGFKFLLWGTISIVFLLCGAAVFNVFRSLTRFASFSHERLFQNETLDSVQNLSQVVQPLIGDNQTFDIAVTVWLSNTEEEVKEARKWPTLLADALSRVDHDTYLFLEQYQRLSVVERPIYSDFAFRGLRLRDKHISKDINLQIPLALFRNLRLNANDLRASFVIVPSSPSLLDYATDYSSWLPQSVERPRSRAYPFPLNSTEIRERMLADKILESFAFSMPLVHFGEIHSQCSTSSPIDFNGEVDDEDSESDDSSYEWSSTSRYDVPVDTSKFTSPREVLRKHPFVITRTQLRIVDETHLFNKKAYDKEHNRLMAHGCEGKVFKPVPNINGCPRFYMANGNWETRIQLDVPEQDRISRQWAYAPYMHYLAMAPGPKDYIPLPVQREKCTTSDTGSVTDVDYLNVTWHLSYTGREPGKFVLGETPWGKQSTDLLTSSQYQKDVNHRNAELWNGAFGHRYYEDSHPRLQLALIIASSIFSTVLTVLDLHFWYTRISTCFISIPGNFMIAASYLTAVIAYLADVVSKEGLLSQTIWQWLWLSEKLLLSFFMLKTLLRLEVVALESRWIPAKLQIAIPTHLERTGERFDARMSWRVRGGILLTMLGLYYTFALHDLFVISTSTLLPSEDDLPAYYGSRILVSSLQLTGRISQIFLNHQWRTFGGSYKVHAFLMLFLAMLDLSFMLPMLVGRVEGRLGFSVHDCIWLLVWMILVFQAIRLHRTTGEIAGENKE